MNDITQKLEPDEASQQLSTTDLLPLVYDELKKLAAARLALEGPGHSLQTTALVHEAYTRLVGSHRSPRWDGRGHFFAAAAEAMRRILVDHARNARRQKRGGTAKSVPLELIDLHWQPEYGDILDLHEALDGLAEVSPPAAELVKLRCFAGQTYAEAALLMDISPRTAKRYWAFARAWLYRAIATPETRLESD
ncbi:ECF sigma factor [Stieleria neptunia]|uniref:ECF sigma factor n=1 Tax=Stieleria neptunia TaxID=2527979 RepID=A0A518HNA7_9BACT|nr:ECF-type sigma factor [Stieleria neptunia]QDV42328.1 ECF sigma factor [Stieleria neptunia]